MSISKWEFEKLFCECIESQKLCEWTYYVIPQETCPFQAFFLQCVSICSSTMIQQVNHQLCYYSEDFSRKKGRIGVSLRTNQ